MFEPALPIRGLKRLAKANHFLMKRTAGRGLLAELRPHPMDSVILNQARRDLRKHFRAEKRDKVILDSSLVVLDISRTTFTLGDNLELINEPSCSLPESLTRFELARLGLTLKSQIPIFCNIFGLRLAFLLGAPTSLLAANACGTLQVPTIRAAKNLHFSAKNLMDCCHRQPLEKMS